MKTCALERAKKNLVNRYEGYVYDKRKQLNYVLMNYSALESKHNKRIKAKKSKQNNKQRSIKKKLC